MIRTTSILHDSDRHIQEDSFPGFVDFYVELQVLLSFPRSFLLEAQRCNDAHFGNQLNRVASGLDH